MIKHTVLLAYHTELQKTISWTTAGQDMHVASGPNPLNMKALYEKLTIKIVNGLILYPVKKLFI